MTLLKREITSTSFPWALPFLGTGREKTLVSAGQVYVSELSSLSCFLEGFLKFSFREAASQSREAVNTWCLVFSPLCGSLAALSRGEKSREEKNREKPLGPGYIESGKSNKFSLVFCMQL